MTESQYKKNINELVSKSLELQLQIDKLVCENKELKCEKHVLKKRVDYLIELYKNSQKHI